MWCQRLLLSSTLLFMLRLFPRHYCFEASALRSRRTLGPPGCVAGRPYCARGLFAPCLGLPHSALSPFSWHPIEATSRSVVASSPTSSLFPSPFFQGPVSKGPALPRPFVVYLGLSPVPGLFTPARGSVPQSPLLCRKNRQLSRLRLGSQQMM